MWLAVGQRLADALTVWALLPTLCVVFDQTFNQTYQMAAILGGILTWVAMGAVDAYRPWRGATYWHEFRVLLGGWLIVVCSLFGVAWVTKTTESYSRLVTGSWFILSPLALIGLHALERMCMRLLRKHGRNTRTAVIVGAASLGRSLADHIRTSDWMGIRLLGFFDDDERKQGANVDGLPILGKCEDVLEQVRKNGVDIVYLALPLRAEARMRSLFDALQDTTASIYWVPDLFMFEMLHARELDVGGMPVFALCESPFFGPFGMLKRLEDIVLSTLILILVSPIMLGIALAVKLSSKGPVLFKQRRYGLDGQIVEVWKFRSMTVTED
ncbi:MAG: undecaprenyl-phosphate glucose phosphotransferase, partial [Gammaproteobacteria bacterium]